jgi:hypothetical protein
MSASKLASLDNELLTSDILMDHYNKLNMIVNTTQYPWDLRDKIIEESFIPTYKNVTLYYKDTTKLLKPPINKKKKGGGQVAQIYFL